MRIQKVEGGPVDVDWVVHVVDNSETLKKGIDDKVLPVGVVEVAESIDVALLESLNHFAFFQHKGWLLLIKFRVVGVLDMHFTKLYDLFVTRLA